MSAKLIDGKFLASQMKREIIAEVGMLRKTPRLAVCIVGDDQPSHIYISKKQNACKEVGIESVCKHFPAASTTKDVVDLIRCWNEDRNIDGILVQLPLPPHLDQFEILNHIDPSKDVDGFHVTNIGRIAHNKSNLLPCTPLAVQHILYSEKVDLVGKHVVIINDTIVVGKPLAMMLSNERATVTMCNKDTKNLQEISRCADVLVVAVGKRPYFSVDKSYCRKGVVVIDVGINRINGKVIGDVENDVREVASLLTPVPGSVGPLTICFLLKNTVKNLGRS